MNVSAISMKTAARTPPRTGPCSAFNDTASCTASNPNSVVNLITGLSATDDVSLNGSPTISPITVGDPFKDTSSVALNPVIKFTTLFGLLAVELAVTLTRDQGPMITNVLALAFFAVSFFFVYRSFYGMRIRSGGAG